MEQKTILDQKWRFIQEDDENAFDTNFDDKNWEVVSLPHTWNAFDVQSGGGTRKEIMQSKKASYFRGVGWYRTALKIPSKEDKRVFVFFEAAGSVAHVYLNGTYLGQHLGAFSAFCFELTPHVKFGEDNILAVKVDNSWRAKNDTLISREVYRNIERASTSGRRLSGWGRRSIWR